MHKATGASASEVREDSERLVSYSAKITAQNSAAGEIFSGFFTPFIYSSVHSCIGYSRASPHGPARVAE